jgi:hypothetical protein
VNKKSDRQYYSLGTALKSSNAEMTKRLNYTKQILTHMINSKPKTSRGERRGEIEPLAVRAN